MKNLLTRDVYMRHYAQFNIEILLKKNLYNIYRYIVRGPCSISPSVWGFLACPDLDFLKVPYFKYADLD